MSTKLAKVALAATMMAGFATAQAKPAVLLTGEPAGNNMLLALDFMADDQPVTAIMVEIKLKPGTKNADIDMSQCVSKLANSHTGGCNIKDNGNLAVLVYGAAANVPLKSGSIGSFVIPKALLPVNNDRVDVAVAEFTLPDGKTTAGDAISEVVDKHGRDTRNTHAK